jgi:hypothetical protein
VKKRIALITVAILAGAIGSFQQAMQVFDLYSLPVGTGVRPMGAPSIFVVFGLGTPPLTIFLVCRAFSHDVTIVTVFLALLALVLAFTPLFNLVLGQTGPSRRSRRSSEAKRDARSSDSTASDYLHAR